MDFKFVNKSKSNEITVSKEMLQEIVSLLDHVECTCVWSEKDNQYICVNEIPQDLVDDLSMKLKLAI